MSESAPPASAPASPPEPASSAGLPDELRVIVRPLPKVVFFWATWLFSFIAGAFPGDPGHFIGHVWMGLFFFNALVISFDFNEERSLIMVLAIIATSVGLLYFNVLGPVTNWVKSLTPLMNEIFYWMIFSGFSVIYLFVWLNTRINYWEFRPNEVVHRHGLFPKMKRYSTEDMRWDKTVPDMLERLLLGTGTIVLTTPHERHPVVLNHVMRIGRIDDQIANILGVKAVVHRDAS